MPNLISWKAQVDESSGRRKFCLVPEEKIREYEKRMLRGSGCPYALPMVFLSEDGEEKACYDFTGFILLAEYIKRETQDCRPASESKRPVFGVLDLLSGILDCIKGLECYLIFPERISIHPDLIFINADNGKVSFGFYPNDKPEEALQNRLVALIGEMNDLYRDQEAELYLNKLTDFIHMKNPGLDGIIALLGTMQREISYIYWYSGNFRKTEEKASYDGERTERNKKHTRLFHGRETVKAIAIQAVFGVGLAAAFLSGTLDPVNFAGLAIIAAGADLWLMRKLHYIK